METMWTLFVATPTLIYGKYPAITANRPEYENQSKPHYTSGELTT